MDRTGEDKTQPNKTTIVVMANKDVYYLKRVDAEELVMELAYPNKRETFSFYDMRSGNKTVVNKSQISSIVERD